MYHEARTFPSTIPPAEQATKMPKPACPAPYASVVSTISATLMPAYASVAQLQISASEERCQSSRMSAIPDFTSRQWVRPILAWLDGLHAGPDPEQAGRPRGGS